MRNEKWGMLVAFCCLSCGVPRSGDLLFHVAGHANPITAVTPDMIDHVALALGSGSVIEALPRSGVVVTPMDSVLGREDGYYVVGRVKGAHRKKSIMRALQMVGLPYDSLYLPANEAVYCSELVLQSVVNRSGQLILKPVPMTFRDSTGRIPDYWQRLYSRHQMDVPEGHPGSNPAELSKRREVRLKGVVLK